MANFRYNRIKNLIKWGKDHKQCTTQPLLAFGLEDNALIKVATM